MSFGIGRWLAVARITILSMIQAHRRWARKEVLACVQAQLKAQLVKVIAARLGDFSRGAK